LGSLPVFSHYNRLFALVLIVNVAALGHGLTAGQWWTGDSLALPTLSGWVTANLSLAILVRQQYLINLLFWLATRVPTSWPLAIRRSLAGLSFWWSAQRCGGCRDRLVCAVVGGDAQDRFAGPGTVSMTLLAVSGSLLGVLLLMAIMALPRIRSTFHNAFERTHRFGGWTALRLFWVMTLIAARDQNPKASLLQMLGDSTSFWMLLLLTFSIVLPWLRLRRVPVTQVKPSSHADCKGSSIGRRSPDRPRPSASIRCGNGIHLPIFLRRASLVSLDHFRAGDWTGRD
jgi:hypothetical protein